MEAFSAGTLAGAGSFSCDECGFGIALHELDGFLAKETGDQEFFDIGRGGHDSGEGERGIGADGYGYVHLTGRHGLIGELRTARSAGGGPNGDARAPRVWTARRP